jgi:outer membrane protein OmpA-like peptidoglycan-associated protein
MRTSQRLFAVAAAAVVLETAAPAAVADGELPAPRVISLTPRVITLHPRVVDVRPKQGHNTVVIEADVLFAFDSARLSSGAASVLNGVIQTLKAEHTTKATITGYTDSIGSPGYNQGLSERRAGAVRTYLSQHLGSGVSYQAVGRGESNPVAPNQTADGKDNPSGRRKNRRVVIAYS